MAESQGKHTPGPWSTDGHSVGVPNGTVCVMYRPGDQTGRGLTQHEQEANARRIVACVNGCAGINPEAVPELVRVLQTIDTMPVDGVSPFVIESMLRQAKAMAYTALAKARGA